LTFKDLQRLVESEAGRSSGSNDSNSPEMQKLLARLRDKPFWINSEKEHKERDIRTKGDCCFNHIIGLPRKDGIEKPMFDYERFLYDALMRPGFMNNRAPPVSDQYYHRVYDNYQEARKIQNNIIHHFKEKHLWVKKATGLGVTEFFLRLMAWLCLRNDNFRNSQMVIVTGPNQDIAIKLIKRMKGLFASHGVYFDSKETVLELNGCSIEAYPSNHLDAYRSLTNPKFILLDEADFFRKSEQEDVRQVTERYIGKSDPYIVMVSTPI